MRRDHPRETKARRSANRSGSGCRAIARRGQRVESGRLKAAFRLMLAAAKMGGGGALLNVAYMYDTGTKRNAKTALYGYKACLPPRRCQGCEPYRDYLA